MRREKNLDEATQGDAPSPQPSPPSGGEGGQTAQGAAGEATTVAAEGKPRRGKRKTTGTAPAVVETPGTVTHEHAGEVKLARQALAGQAKNTAKKITELFGAAMDLEQLALFDTPEFEEALLMDRETLRKKYTGELAEKMEWRRDACLYMISHDCPVEEIAVILRMNLRTVAALASQNGRKLAAFSERFAHELLADAAADLAYAGTKRGEASYKDLHIGAGIKLQHAAAIKQVADLSGDGKKDAMDIEAESPELRELRDKMKRLAPAEPEATVPGESEATDGHK